MNSECNFSSMHVSSVSGKILNTLESSALMLGSAVPTVGLATSAYMLIRDLSMSVMKWAKKNDSSRLREDVVNDRSVLNNLCAYKDIVKLYQKQRLIDESLEDPNLFEKVSKQLTVEKDNLEKVRCDLKKDPLHELISANLNVISSLSNASESALNLCIQYFSDFDKPNGIRLQLKKINEDWNCNGEINPNSKIGIACLSIKLFFNFVESPLPDQQLDASICIDEEKSNSRDSFVKKLQTIKGSLNQVSAELSSKLVAENQAG